MKVGKHASLLPWQTGCLISTKAVQEMFVALKEEYDIDHILTCRLNQDPLEILFSQIRRLNGSSSTFGAVEFKYLLRKLILGCGDNLPVAEAASAIRAQPEETLQDNFQEFTEGLFTAEKAPEEDTGSLNDILAKMIEDANLPSVSLAVAEADEAEEEEDEDSAENFQNATITEEIFVPEQWLSLCPPGVNAADFKADLVKMDCFFVNYHIGCLHGLNREKNVIANIVTILIENFSNQYDEKLLKNFATSRLYFRLRNVRQCLRRHKETARSKKKVIDYLDA